MGSNGYTAGQTALLFVDPYNDFLSEGGKLWPYIREVAAEVHLLDNLRAITVAIRGVGIKIFMVPHHRWEPDDFKTWDFPNPYQLKAADRQTFAKGSWGSEWASGFAPQPGDVVVKEHWGSSGFANTDLDLQLKQHGIRKVIVIGLLANTCIEATGRSAAELGYHVTLVKDATAAFSKDRMHAAHDLNGPTYAHAVLTTAELISVLSSRSSPTVQL